MPKLKFLIAIMLFAALGTAAWQTLTDGTVRAVTLAVVASFAARTYLQYRRETAGAASTTEDATSKTDFPAGAAK